MFPLKSLSNGVSAIRRAPAYTADASELASLLGCDKRTVYNLVTRGVIPHYRVGRALRFDAARVLEALEQSR